MRNRYEPVFSISVVRRMTGLTERQIRYWEQQQVIAPARTPGNHRLYSQADVDDLLLAARLRNRGYRLDEILEFRQRQRSSDDRHESDALFRFRSPVTAGTIPQLPGQKANIPVTEDRAKLLEEIERRRAERAEKGRETGNG
ncbi:MAG: MerR family transcriptional regulator [Bacillota bacterium]